MPMRLTPRDIELVLAIHAHRVLRRDQVQRLLFPSKNTANERLKRLHQHGYLVRRRLPVEYGLGSSQALYLLARRGAQLVAERLGVDIADVDWSPARNRVSTFFLEHTIAINDVRIAVTLAAARRGYAVERWIAEDELKRAPERVAIEDGDHQSTTVAFVPDGYFLLNLGPRRASFFLEVDRATMANARWARKVRAYLAYVRSGAYARRYRSNCLRVLTVTTSEKRMRNLLRTTKTACADGSAAHMFWFTWLDQVTPEAVLSAPIWHIPGRSELVPLISPKRAETPALRGAPMLLFRS
jgi:hypothetical protein